MPKTVLIADEDCSLGRLMVLRKTLRILYAERERLDRAIVLIKQTRAPALSSVPQIRTKRRGRKSMGAEERMEVSARMKQYWASRRFVAVRTLPAGGNS